MPRKEVQTHFSLAARSYDGATGIQRQMAKELEMAVNGHIPAPGAVAELGCGTGHLSALLEQSPQVNRLQLVDLSHDMLEQCRTRLPQSPKLCFVQADAEQWSLPPETRLCISNATFQWFQDLPAFLARTWQALPQDGVLAFTIFGRQTLRELYTTYRDTMRVPLDRQAQFWEAEKLERALTQARFQVRLMRTREEQLNHPDLRSLLGQIKAMGATYRPAERSPLTRASFARWSDLYRLRHPAPEGDKNGVISSWQWHLVVAEKFPRA
jgi:malonyl-CoA O-methyltransferase